MKTNNKNTTNETKNTNKIIMRQKNTITNNDQKT